MMFQTLSPIVASLVAGALILIGYIIQKRLEHRNHIKSMKLKIYSNYLKYYSLYAGDNGNEHIESLHYWRIMMILYASDRVLKQLNMLCKAEYDTSGSNTRPIINEMLVSMRRDISRKSKVNVTEMQDCSPFDDPVMDDEPENKLL